MTTATTTDTQVTPLTRYTVGLTALGTRLARKDIHKILMRALPDNLNPDHPRADAELLWRHNGGTLTIQTSRELHLPDNLGTPITAEETHTPDHTVRITAEVNRVYAPTIHLDEDTQAILKAQGKPVLVSGKRAPVPDDRLHDWATGLLERRGLTIAGDDLTVERVRDVVIEKTRRNRTLMPAAKITATIEPGDALSRYWTEGLGRGKNYGFGLITEA